MTDPKRWVEDSADLSPIERRVLEAAARIEPAPGLESELLARIGAQLENSATLRAEPGARAELLTRERMRGSKWRARRLAIAVGLAAALSGALAAGALLVGHLRERASTVAPAQISSGAPSPSVRRPRGLVAPQSGSVAPPEAASADDVALAPDGPALPAAPPAELEKRARPTPTRSAGPLTRDAALDEATAVADARSLLRAGSPGLAVTRLEQIRVLFPNGLLGQEREALTIEALGAAGQKAAAKQRAAAFLARYPNSPHAAAVRSALN